MGADDYFDAPAIGAPAGAEDDYFTAPQAGVSDPAGQGGPSAGTPIGPGHALALGGMRGFADLGNTVLNAQDWVNAHVPPFSLIPGNPQAAQARIGERAQYVDQFNREYGSNPLAMTARLGANTAAISPFLLAAPETATLGGNATLGAGGAALLSGGSNNPLMGQMAGGAVGGALLPAAVRGIAGVMSPSLPVAAQYLRNMGIDLTPGQALGGMWARLEQGMQSIPGLGDLIKNRTVESFHSFNKAVGNDALAPIGARIPDDVPAGNASVEHVRRALGARYDEILAKGTLNPQSVISNLNAAVQQAPHVLPQEQASTLQSILQRDVIDVINKNPQNAVSGPDYKGMDSALRHEAEVYLKMEKRPDRDLGQALNDLRTYLRTEFDQQNPSLAGELQPVDQGWARFARFRQAAASQAAGKHEGIFTPEQFNAAVRAQDKSRAKGDYSEGNALMQPLAQAANEVMGSKVPDSGSPYRLLATLAAGGMAHEVPYAPEAMMLLGGAALPYTQPGMRLLNALLTQRPAALQVGGNVLRQVAPYTAPVGAALNPFLSNQP